MPPTTPSGRRRSSEKASVKSRMLRTVRSLVSSASISNCTMLVEPPKAASRVFNVLNDAAAGGQEVVGVEYGLNTRGRNPQQEGDDSDGEQERRRSPRKLTAQRLRQ